MARKLCIMLRLAWVAIASLALHASSAVVAEGEGSLLAKCETIAGRMRKVNETLSSMRTTSHEEALGTAKMLLAEMQENIEIAKENSVESKQTQEMHRRNRELHQLANSVRRDIEKLKSKLQAVQNHISEGQEYVASALKLASEPDSDMTFLHALNAKETQDKHSADLQHRLAEIERMGRSSRRALSLLQPQESRAELPASSTESLVALDEALDSLTEATMSSADKLKTVVNEQRQEVARHRERLLGEHAHLARVQTAARRTGIKLQRAVESLTAKKRRLRVSLGAVQLMGRRYIGGMQPKLLTRTKSHRHASHSAAPVSFLQQTAEVAHKSDDNDFKSGGAFNSASSRIDELQSQLTRMEINNKRSQAQRKSEYEQQLSSKRRENLEVASMNAHLVQEISGMKKSAKALRSQATDLREDVDNFEADWTAMEGNLSTALEITGKVLTGMHGVNDAPELRILEELNERDRGIGKSEQHRHRFDEILDASLANDVVVRAEKLALLQVGAPGGARGALLTALESGLRDLTAENDRALHTLDTRFRALLKEESDLHTGLLSEQRMLEGRRSQIDATTVRLRSTIAHLQSLNHNTSKRAVSVRAYFAQLGGRSLPAKNDEVVTLGAASKVTTTEQVTPSASMASTAPPAHNEDPDMSLFEFDSLLKEPANVQTMPPPHASALEMSSSLSSKAPDGSEQSGPGNKKKWVQWLTR